MEEAEQDLKKLQEAEKLFKEGRFGESESLYNRLIASRHVGPRAKSGLGIIYLHKGQNAKAEECFRSVVRSGHQVAEAYYGLGVIFEVSDPSYAKAQYEFALGINPKHSGSLSRIRKLERTASQTATKNEPERPKTSGQAEPHQPLRSLRKAPPRQVYPPPLPAVPVGKQETVVESGHAENGGKSPSARKGIATYVKIRTEQRGTPSRQIQIIEFRLQRSAQPTIPVYMSGHRLVGTIKEGDRITLQGRNPKVGKIFVADKIYNEDAGGYVTMSGMGLSDSDVGKLFHWIAFLIVIGLVVVGGIISSQK